MNDFGSNVILIIKNSVEPHVDDLWAAVDPPYRQWLLMHGPSIDRIFAWLSSMIRSKAALTRIASSLYP